MSETVWKAPLDPQFPAGQDYAVCLVRVPEDAEFLHVAEQGDGLCVWFRCQPDLPMKERKLFIVPTGGEIPVCHGGWKAKHISTFLQNGGMFVWHAFAA